MRTSRRFLRWHASKRAGRPIRLPPTANPAGVRARRASAAPRPGVPASSESTIAESMHAAERESLILQLLRQRGFIAFQELDRQFEASPATLRRDLDKLESAGHIV